VDTTLLAARAERLAELHATMHPLVLPTVWDVWSARTAVAAGFAALTIGSHPLADSRGAQDHEGQTFAEVLTAVRPIIAAAGVPVSVVSKTFAETGWARLWTMTWARADHPGPR
jgi:2-methylisocitrate lyase-like PEP mutase family enzyme